MDSRIWLAERRQHDDSAIVSVHRTKAGAIDACERDHGGVLPWGEDIWEGARFVAYSREHRYLLRDLEVLA